MIDAQGFATRILIVDDRELNRDALRSYLTLTSSNYLVDTAKGGPEALEKLESQVFDVVLCDLKLRGEMDGGDVTRAIVERHPTVRVVVFSGVDTGTSKEKVLEAGAFFFLAKPIKRAELRHAIETINSIRRTEKLHEWFATLTRISYDLQKSFDFEAIAHRIVQGVSELGFARARLYLYDRERDTLVGKVAYGMPAELEFDKVEIPVAASPIVRRIFQKDRPLFCDREAILSQFDEPSVEPWMSELGLEETTWIDCPLLIHAKRIGTLSIDNHGSEDYRFTEEERQILGLLSGFAAQALYNSRLYEKEALANASLRSIMREAPDAMVTTDLDGTITFVSPSSEAVLGYTSAEMLRRRAADFYTDEHGTKGLGRKIAREIMNTLLKGETISNRRIFLKGRTGTPRPISMSVSLLRDERQDRDEAVGTLGILKDLGVIEDQSRQYRDLLEGFGYGTLLLRRNGTIAFVNRKAHKMLGRPRESLLDAKFVPLVAPAQRAELERCLADVGDKCPEHTLDLALVQRSGHSLPVRAVLTPARQDRSLGAVAVGLYDKSELGALIQSGRLMALGEMVAGMAHEISNPLNHILVAASELQAVSMEQDSTQDADSAGDAGTDDLEAPDYVGMIQRNGLRIDRIVRQLREFVRPGDFERSPKVLLEVVESGLRFFSTRLRNKNISVAIEAEEDIPPVMADAPRLQQVIINLIVNAEHAMEGQQEPKEVKISLRFVAETERVQMDISDSGPGIAPNVRDSIFDPFFSTKAPNEGTGLGLSISKSIIDLHDGTIQALELGERGACIRIELPVAVGSIPSLEDGPSSSEDVSR